MVLIPAGVPMASLAPSAILATANWGMVRARPWPAAARLQAITPTGLASFTPSQSEIRPVNSRAKAEAAWNRLARAP